MDKMQQPTPYKYINVVPFSSLVNWSASFALGNTLDYKEGFKLVKIGKLIERNKTKIEIQDNVSYRRVTIRLYGKGVLQRDEVMGNTIGTKNQYVISGGQFIMSKIDARNGAFGIVPNELEGAIVTQDFLSYNINTDLVLPEFFLLLTSTQKFLDLCQRASSGTTGRQRVDEKAFLNFEIPLPRTIEEQKDYIDSYNNKISKAIKKEKESQDAGLFIESLFLEKLGLKQIEQKSKRKGLQLVQFKNLERWDVFSSDNIINSELKKSHFELKPLGTIYNFVRRGWDKRTHKEKSFKYIEIGAVDSIRGIIDVKTIETKKAPSRASQIVKEGDLIIATTRPYLKKFAIVDSEYQNCVCSSGFSVLEKSPEYNLQYLKLFLSSFYGIEQLKNKMTGALYPAITETELKNINIPFPDLDFQNSIVEMAEEKYTKILLAYAEAEGLRETAIDEFEKSIFKS